jgi:hypothetical protein
MKLSNFNCLFVIALASASPIVSESRDLQLSSELRENTSQNETDIEKRQFLPYYHLFDLPQ